MANSNTVEVKLQLIDEISGAAKNITGSLEGVEDVVKKVVDAAKKQKEVFDKNTDSLIKLKSVSDAISHVSDTIMQTAAPAIEFQQRMADLSAITGVVGDDLDRVADMARRIGKESGLGAGEAARAFAVLAGQLDAPINDIGLILEKSATLAQAAGLTIDDAAGSLAATISQYGLAAQDADRVMNVLAAGSRAGASEVVDLAQSFKVVGAAAASLGVDVEHTAGALEVLGAANIKGSEAGTALRNVLLSLKTGLGIDTSVVDLSDALASLQPHLHDTEFLAKTFGVANVTAATYLIQNADAVREMTEAVTDSQAAQEQAEIRNATWAHQLETTRAAIDNVMISIGSALGPMASVSVVLCEGAEKFVALGEAAKLATVVGGKFAGVAAGMGRMLSHPVASVRLLSLRLNMLRKSILQTSIVQRTAAIVTGALTAAQHALNAAMAANPIGLIITGIVLLVGLLVAGIRACINNFKTWGETVLMLMGPIGWVVAAFVKHWDSIKKAFTDGGIIGGLKRIGIVLLDVLLLPLQHLLDLLSKIPGLGKLAAKGSDMLHGLRERLNLTEGEAKIEVTEKAATDPATGKPKEAARPVEAARPTVGVGEAVGKTAARATAQQSQIKRIDITIDKVVESFTVNSTTLQQGAADIRDMVARALVDAVNDVNYAL